MDVVKKFGSACNETIFAGGWYIFNPYGGMQAITRGLLNTSLVTFDLLIPDKHYLNHL
jgi:hypothetical protein